jgi:stringent starvation protein B
MKSQRPYLLRALHEWIVDSGATPHLLVDAGWPGVVVPPEAVTDGSIVLNVAPEAVRGLLMGDDEIEFECRFGGVPRAVAVPVDAVRAIYARENGAGMAFEAVAPDDGGPDAPSPDDGPPDGDPPEGGPADGGGRGHLKVVK